MSAPDRAITIPRSMTSMTRNGEMDRERAEYETAINRL